MAEKRYQWYIDGVDIWDNQKEERIDDTPTLLNELSKENEQLKQRINSRLHFYRELYESTNDNVVKRVIEDLEDILK